MAAMFALILPVAANATDFKCGKDFVTFMYEEGDNYLKTRLTLPKKDILRIFSMVDKPSNVEGPDTWVTITHPLKADAAIALEINEVTRRSIIDCLD